MTKTETKHAAQDEIMHWVANAALIAEEGGEEEKAAEIRRQGKRIMKLYGYESWPGIG